MKKILSLLFFLIFSVNVFGITIYNKTDKKVFGALYYRDRKKAIKTSKIFSILPKKKYKIDRLKYKKGFLRRLLFSWDELKLLPLLSRDQYKLLGRLDISLKRGTSFYIYKDKGVLKGANSVQWKIVNPLKDVGSKIKRSVFSSEKEKYMKPYPRSKMRFNVRKSTDICAKEKSYLTKRKVIAKKALEKFLGMSLTDNQVPTIAFAGSGGGVRAQLSTLGFLLGADELGLLDCASYIAGVSGSTWAIGGWLASDLTLKGFEEYLTSRLITDPFKSYIQEKLNPKNLIDIVYKKFIFNQPISLVDIYGGVLGRHFFGGFSKNPHTVDLLAQAKKLEDGSVPLPIYTAVITRQDPFYRWWEFTPYEFGSDYLVGYISERASGQSFINGRTRKVGPPLTLEFILGVCGSAFAVNGKEIFERVVKDTENVVLKKVLEKILKQELGTKRMLPAKIKNFTRGLKNLPRANDDILSLIDAGISINIPMQPLFRKARRVDIIIVLDASGDLKTNRAKQLEKTKVLMDNLGIDFPKFNVVAAANKKCSVFYTKNNPNIPMIICLPLIKNESYSKDFDPRKVLREGGHLDTFNFVYTKEQSKQLIGLTKANMLESKDIIKSAIKDRIELNKIVPKSKS